MTSTEFSSRRSQELLRGCDLHLHRSIMLRWGEQGVRQNGDTDKRAKVLENDADFLPDTVVTLALWSGEVYVSGSHCLLKAWGHN